MTNLPADLSPEAAAWLQTQMAIQSARTAAILREEINKVDDWAYGIFVALREGLGNLIFDKPSICQALARDWGSASRDFDRIQAGKRPTHHADETLQQLEARALLYRFFVKLGMMPRER